MLLSCPSAFSWWQNEFAYFSGRTHYNALTGHLPASWADYMENEEQAGKHHRKTCGVSLGCDWHLDSSPSSNNSRIRKQSVSHLCFRMCAFTCVCLCVHLRVCMYSMYMYMSFCIWAFHSLISLSRSITGFSCNWCILLPYFICILLYSYITLTIAGFLIRYIRAASAYFMTIMKWNPGG